LDQHALDDGIQRKDTGIEKGTHNQVIGVTLNNDQKARGKRAVLIEWEEFGKFDNLLKHGTLVARQLKKGVIVFVNECVMEQVEPKAQHLPVFEKSTIQEGTTSILCKCLRQNTLK
jgi:hypothetical protein